MTMDDIKSRYKEQFKEVIADLKTKGRRKKQIPNLLTASRALAPFIIIPLSIMGQLPMALVATALFATTDFFDGALARKWGVCSDFGRDLDATVDKIFAGTLLISFSIAKPLLLVPLAFEATIGAINTIEKIKGHNPKTVLIGKFKTASLSLLIIELIIATYASISSIVLNLTLIQTIILQGLTTGNYLKKYFDNKTIDNEPKNVEENYTIVEAEEKELEKGLDNTKSIHSKSEKLKMMKQMLLHEVEINTIENQNVENIDNNTYQKTKKDEETI